MKEKQQSTTVVSIRPFCQACDAVNLLRTDNPTLVIYKLTPHFRHVSISKQKNLERDGAPRSKVSTRASGRNRIVIDESCDK